MKSFDFFLAVMVCVMSVVSFFVSLGSIYVMIIYFAAGWFSGDIIAEAFKKSRKNKNENN